MAGEGPKLTHLTTSRPKVPRGRRPPKRYAVFHEDDSNPVSAAVGCRYMYVCDALPGKLPGNIVKVQKCINVVSTVD